jgi:branched-chain amino acid transport system ATP-binding protein
MQARLRRTRRGCCNEERLSLILVEQNTRLALEISPRTIIMNRGRIAYDGASRELKENPATLDRLIGVGRQ